MASFTVWLLDYFKHLPHELDADVLGDYITGILDESSGQESAELPIEIAELLSAYLPDDLAHKASKTIIDRYFSPVNQPSNGLTASANTDPMSGDNATLTLEDHMRSLLVSERERLKSSSSTSTACSGGAREDTGSRGNRDACTLAVLREAGVAGYQSNSDEERSLEIAVANADFQARQRLTVGVSTDAAVPLAVDGEATVVDGDAGVPEAVEVDMEELSGYGKKPEAKPGTVADALAELSFSNRAPLAGPAPMAFSLSTFTSGPSRQLANGCCPSTAPCVAPSSVQATGAGGRQRRGKKTNVTVPKHIARVGAQAEAESRRRQQVASGTTAPSARGVGARRDELDAFLFSDDGEESQKVSLPDGGRNHESVRASESARRQTAASEAAERRAKDKAERARQLTEASERRQAAQKRAQKVERRR